MKQVGACSGCRHPIAVPEELLRSPIVCPNCGRVISSSKTRKARLLGVVGRNSVTGILMFLIGMGVASGILDDRRSSRSQYDRQPNTRGGSSIFRDSESNNHGPGAVRPSSNAELQEVLQLVRDALRQPSEAKDAPEAGRLGAGRSDGRPASNPIGDQSP